ncbi:hypothetical protein [Streptomyces sp. NBC_00057]|uniref:hypothetical protein n=1 Tax=Streptomyces sp. NBC_00057 TaxID=2975634 RepID=UPI003251863C
MSGLLGTVIVPHRTADLLFDGHKGVRKAPRTAGTEHSVRETLRTMTELLVEVRGPRKRYG